MTAAIWMVVGFTGVAGIAVFGSLLAQIGRKDRAAREAEWPAREQRAVEQGRAIAAREHG